jgi:hypothetical protein
MPSKLKVPCINRYFISERRGNAERQRERENESPEADLLVIGVGLKPGVTRTYLGVPAWGWQSVIF